MSVQHRSQASQTKAISKGLHLRNLHRQGYDFLALIKSYPLLASHVKANAYGNLSIDFADPVAVKSLNTALLKHHYNISGWDIPAEALCPPIPGRVDYIHFIAELLGCVELTAVHATNQANISLLDIGVGANGIYPLLASQIYGWNCVGSDINYQSLENVAAIIANNSMLKDRVELRWQQDKNRIFDGIIQPGEYFDVSVCNPPFHSSEQQALKASRRKLTNLARNRGAEILPSRVQNFGGLEAELWCKGGEKLFIKKLIKESQMFSTQCRWFTSLISKIDNVNPAKKLLNKLGVTEVREIEMAQGNKITRILAWTFI
jgi:23S rRNA (adenine1618-N6)-methyltransferase